jgi:phage terminase large subunit-like protein
MTNQILKINQQKEILELMIKNRNFRIALAKQSHYWFFHFYFPHYVTFPTADFHREIFYLTEQEDIGMSVITAFRSSSKSTICSLSYVLWSILGKQNKKFAVIISQTQRQAKLHLTNIKRELEQNHLLSADLGPFKEEPDEWGGFTLVIPKYGARIMAASSEQGIRGIRYLQHRPDVIVADDIEDLQSVRTQEARDKTYEWFKGDVIPSGGPNVKVIVVGNLLHEDSLLKRLQEEIKIKTTKGECREYPLINSEGKIMWPGRFPTPESIDAEKEKIGNEAAWHREYLLEILPASDQVVQREWIHYYDELPAFQGNNYYWTKIAVDLAISEKESADYTAMVIGSLFGRDRNMRLYIHPFPINERLNFPEAIEKAKLMANNKILSRRPEFLVEAVGYQTSFAQQLEREWYVAKEIKVGNLDKRSRLALVSDFIKNGNILFPRKGCEALISQLVGFGVEKHDDLMDAFVLLATYAADKGHGSFGGIGKPDRI